MKSNFQISSPSVGFATQSAAQGGMLTVRTSQKSFQSVGAGGAGGFSSTQRGLGSYSVKRTTSFSAIHEDVSSLMAVSDQETSVTYPSGPRRSRGENPGGNAVGDNTVPVGDMLLPVLAMAAAYIIIKLFRNRKTSQAL